jgi:hypothetical protein
MQCKFTNSQSVPICFLLIIDKPRLIVALQFGWGLEIDVKNLKEINELKGGKDYFDTTAATAVNGHTKKAELTESPFLVTFEFGGDRGY